MDLLDQPDIKKTYEKCKYIVKLWEHKFVKKYKRLPSKLDIREANRDVRNAYRKYFQIKTTALEQSFMDVEGFDDEQEENGETKDSESTKCEETICNNLKSQVTSRNTEQNTQQPQEVWGTHLNKKDKEEDKPNVKKEQPVKSNLNLSITKKLFCGSKFTKRNPRKSLSFSQKTKSDVSVENQIFLSQPIPITTSTFKSFTSEEAICLSQDLPKSNTFQIVTPAEKISSQPVNIIQTVLQNNYQHALQTVDTGWLQRVVQNTGTTIDNPELPLPSSPALLYKLNNPVVPEIKNTESTKIDYDSDDIIDESDDDDTSRKDIMAFHVAKKRKIDELEKNINIDVMDSSCMKINNYTEETNKTMAENKSNDNTKMSISFEDAINSETDMSDNVRRKCEMVEEMTAIEVDQNRIENHEKEPSLTTSAVNRQKKQKLKVAVKKKVDKPKKEQKEISPRRSSRQTKVKVSFQELSSEEEDAFHTDTDDKDPEFSLDSEKSKRRTKIFELEETDDRLSKKKHNRKSAIGRLKTKTNLKKEVVNKEKLEKEIEETDENKPYELEFSVKPRIATPRYSSIKKVLTENTILPKGNEEATCSKNEKQIPSKIKNKTEQAKERLEKKIAAGNLNDNYVLVNLKKKVFVRGKRGHSFSKFKKAQWKSKKAKALSGPDMDMGGCDGGMLTCFTCGQIGHFARNCKATKGDGLLPLTSEQEEDCPYPTLEEASLMAQESNLSIRKPKIASEGNKHLNQQCDEESPNVDTDETDDCQAEENDVGKTVEDWIEDDFDDEKLLLESIKLEEHVKKLDVQSYMDTVKAVRPYFNLDEGGSMIATPPEVYETLKKFGHDSFRPGQEQAIMRILSGKSTLVTLSTGSGKSLCYQLPAYLYSQREPCVSLVISPLVSLMDDQVVGIPKFMKAACLHSNQTKTQRQKILEAISKGELNILLLSPEAVVAGEKQVGFGSLLRKLPPIAFACIDEAHCVSQWSHNFRPSYLMICRVLRESLGIKTILGLTATATKATRDSIIDHLRIPDGHDGVISDIPLPDNLMLTASKDSNRDHALLGLLMSERFSNCKSIIVYCTRRDECERIASFLRTSLKNEQVVQDSNKKRKRVNLQAEPYHAGLSASRRRSIQNCFMSGELRIVVATVAFGMGINKADIRAVIHFNMPNSFESYVQEVGRAGRDGLPAQCHVFLDSQGRDENELRRHIHANSIDRHVIRKLLQKIFIPCSCTGQCPKHEVAFSIDDTVRALDIPEENISTLLCYLELHENKYIELLSPAYTTCKVISYSGPMEIRKAAKDCPPLAMALALHKGKGGDNANIIEFPVVDVAAAMGWESGICKHKLKNLEWTTVNNRPKRSAISVQFSNLGFRLLAPGNLSDDQLDEALDSLHGRVINQEEKALLQLHAVHKTLVGVAQPSYRSCIANDGGSLIKSKVREYFNSSDLLKFIPEIEPKKFNEEQLVNDIRALICMYKDNTFTGRSVARIFQGIQSPNYPATVWGRCRFWRSHLDVEFHTIVKIASREIINMR